MIVDTIAAGIMRVTAPNPGPKTLDGTNCYLVGEDNRLVIDPGPDLPVHTAALGNCLAPDGVRAILLTHAHPDHAGAAPALAKRFEVPVYLKPGFAPSLETQIRDCRAFDPDQSIHVGGRAIRVIPTPGHSFDHVCFFVEDAGLLFSGDTILGSGSTLIARPEGNMMAYMNTLASLTALQPRLIAPGHGPVITDPLTKIDEYVRHRHEREQQLLKTLACEATVEDLVASVYGPMSPEVARLAALSAEAQLDKLLAEGKVRRNGSTYVATDTAADG